MNRPSPILNVRGRTSKDRPASFTLRNRLERALWMVVWIVFASWTPKVFRRWRCMLLRMFGAKLGNSTDVRASARVWLPAHLTMEAGALIGPGVICYNMAPITLGSGALISQRAHLCAGSHDFDEPDFQLVARPITIGAEAWIAAEAFVGPGVSVGDGAVLGARAAAFRDLEPWTVYSGNPAAKLRRRRVRDGR